MKKASIGILITCALATSLLMAQTNNGPRNPAARVDHQVKFMTTLLSLTPAQQQQATTIFTNAANDESSLRSNMRAAHEELATAVKNNDTAGIDKAASTIGNLTAQSISVRSKADAAFYQILTPDQQNKASQLQSEGPGFMFHGGPMPPMGPGPR